MSVKIVLKKEDRLLNLLQKKIKWDKFLYIQRCMQQGNGTAVYLMNDVLGIKKEDFKELDDFFNNIEI